MRFLCLFAVTLLSSSSVVEPDGLRQLVAAGSLPDLGWPKFSDCQAQVANFYQSGGYAPAWTRDGAPTNQARATIAILQNAGEKGLDAEDYDGSRWPARLARLRPAVRDPSGDALASFDLALTVSAMRYITDSSVGKVNPKVLCFAYDVESRKCNLPDVLRRRVINAADVRAALEQLEPPFPAYRRVLKALQKYQELAREDDAEQLPATKKTIEPGDSYPGVPRLERLLRRLGDLPANGPSVAATKIYQGALVDALKQFQIRHGIDPDGRIGKNTLTELNTPLSQRVQQLRWTLERWRWIPNEFARPPIVVNIPEFRLRAMNDRYETELEMKVVVGGAYRRQTPVFTNDMTHVIFRPYWNVPLSIQRNELVPKLAKDASYLGRNEYQVVNSRGDVVEREAVSAEMLPLLRSGKLSVRQVPGAKNALGHIKFMFPNEYNVYLHGTPAKSLFSRARRDFSHGCIRVENPEELAAWVLRGKAEWTIERIRAEENAAGPPLQVNLDRPIPVLIVYSTAVASQSGEVYFFRDIYKHDAALQALLDKGYPYSDWKPPSRRSSR